jgi:hypothetical protein
MELGRAAGDVERGDGALPEHLQHEIDGAGIHRLGAVRPGVDVAMEAGLVAAVAEVDLKRGQPPAPDRRKGDGPKPGKRFVHRSSSREG